jgi:hypothetical protein
MEVRYFLHKGRSWELRMGISISHGLPLCCTQSGVQNLELDNTVPIRETVSASASAKKVSTTNFQLSSPAFVDGRNFPIEYTCDGAGMSPALAWSGAPAGTKSFAVTFDTLPGPLRRTKLIQESMRC